MLYGVLIQSPKALLCFSLQTPARKCGTATCRTSKLSSLNEHHLSNARLIMAIKPILTFLELCTPPRLPRVPTHLFHIPDCAWSNHFFLPFSLHSILVPFLPVIDVFYNIQCLPRRNIARNDSTAARSEDQGRTETTHSGLVSNSHHGSPYPSGQKQSIHASFAALVSGWYFELLSIVLSAFCLVVIMVVLLRFDNEEIPLPYYGLTINTMISILSGILKASLLVPTTEAVSQLKWSWFRDGPRDLNDLEVFDNASRGPWGSLILRMRNRGRSLASFGVAITVLSVALDPFFQGLVVYPQRLAPLQNSTLARTSRSITYDSGEQYEKTAKETWFLPDGIMQGLVTPQLLGVEMEQAMPFVCPSGICTWDVFNSLSVDSTCRDVSDILEWGCLNSVGDWLP
ncbi:hypothetical protein K402DRAFT_185009 [Aulographum hederae CBS 113979]|uniref:Uncharacterized protein n=1 Tax=Aulographum hederae CBS 113979 TaxID=1176131 RepID=A0A6G1GQ82_9PEZI|nr:hypothetical protein K402DRAFT_185009 [Aulographum hederae CBS 113979]